MATGLEAPYALLASAISMIGGHGAAGATERLLCPWATQQVLKWGWPRRLLGSSPPSL